MIDRITGEVVYGKIEDYCHYELGAFTDNGFRRNVIATNLITLQEWQTKYSNTGIFRGMLSTNATTIEDLDDSIFYGDLCFDFDVSKDVTPESWSSMLDEVETKLIPHLCMDFGITKNHIRIWFSGGRGLHIELPSNVMGTWPHKDLHRIYGFYARDLSQLLQLKFLDLSLYGAKHLYRLEGSKHQRTGLHKIPLNASEFPVLRNWDFLTKVATLPRNPIECKWNNAPSTKSYHRYDTMVKGALELKREPMSMPGSIGDRNRYDRKNYLCITTMMSEDYHLGEGSRHSMVFFYANHLRQNGFSSDEARKELLELAANHCEPPLVGRTDSDFIDRVLQEAFTEVAPVGCSYIQRNVPHLCDEKACPLGRLLISRRKNLLKID